MAECYRCGAEMKLSADFLGDNVIEVKLKCPNCKYELFKPVGMSEMLDGDEYDEFLDRHLYP